MKKIIFVCTGNTCRSPMAEMIMKDLLNKHNISHISVHSRGLSVPGPVPVNPHVETVLREQEINLLPHLSTPLTQDDLTDNPLILTMTQYHKQLIHHLYSANYDQIYSLSEYVTGSPGDIQDPYGRSIETYKKCFFQLQELLTILVKNLPSL